MHLFASSLARPRAAGTEPANRTRLLDTVHAHPYITKSDLCRRTGLAWGVVDHHVRVLLARRRIHATRVGKELRIAPAHRRVAHPSLALPDGSRTLAALRHGGGLDRETLMARLHLSRGRLQRVLDALEADGLVHGIGRYGRTYHLTPSGGDAAAA